MSLMEEIVKSVVDYEEYRYNFGKEKIRKDFEEDGFKPYFAHELTSCRKKSELGKVYPELEKELMGKPPVMLGEIVQRGVKAYLPKDVEEGRIFCKLVGDFVVIGTPDFYSESRRSVYELKFISSKPKVLEHHRLKK